MQKLGDKNEMPEKISRNKTNVSTLSNALKNNWSVKRSTTTICKHQSGARSRKPY